MVARFVGAGDMKTANHVAAQALILSAGWGALMMIFGMTMARPIIGLFGLEAEVVNQGISYMRVLFAGWITMDLLVMCLYVIQSSGDTIRPMFMEAFLRVIHISLCPFLVLGYGPFPKMGVSGAALSNIISQTIGAIICLWLLFGGYTRLHLKKSDFRVDFGVMWRILKIGIPALVMNVQRSLGGFILTKLIAPFGTMAVAAHSLTLRLEMFVMMPPMALGMGAGVLVGQNLGAQQPARAEKSAWIAVGIFQAFMTFCSAVILIWAENIMGIFTTDPELITLGSAFIRISAAVFFVMSIAAVLQNCIASAGDTVPNMIISIAAMWIAQIPVAWLLSQYTSLGVYGIRWAMVISTGVGAIIYFTYFRLGRWKLKKV
jgi:putative MATE family efflux protein